MDISVKTIEANEFQDENKKKKKTMSSKTKGATLTILMNYTVVNFVR